MRNYTFLKEPLPYTPSDYEQVKDKVVGAFKINSSLGSIYQIGTISTPGISDLDLILIFDNDVRKVDYSSFYGQLDNRDRYILMHSPFIITRNLFENMRYFGAESKEY